MMRSECLICQAGMVATNANKHKKRFCDDACRNKYHKACRIIGEEFIESGVVSISEVRRRVQE
jgi:hypothetical protein